MANQQPCRMLFLGFMGTLILLSTITASYAADGDISWSTVFGGSAADIATAISVDAAGAIYVAGQSSSLDYPTSNPYQPESGGGADVVVSKLNPAGTTLLWSTYLGGAADDLARDLRLDDQGRVWICGDTRSGDFPVTMDAYQTNHGGGIHDAFVAALDVESGQLVYSSFLGGSGADYATTMDLHPGGGVVLSGTTASSNFPTTPNTIKPTWTPSFFDGSEGYITHLQVEQKMLGYSTYIGSTGTDVITAIHVGADGVVTVAGHTTSLGFPVSPNAFQTQHGLDWDGFVTRLQANMRGYVFSTFFGGDGKDQVLGMALEADGDIIISGKTGSTDLPVSPAALQGNYQGGLYDGFVGRIEENGTTLGYGSYLGGEGDDLAVHPLVLSDGRICVVGQTASPDYPVMGGGAELFLAGGFDAMITVLGVDGSLSWSSFLGGSGNDQAKGAAWDVQGRIVTAGWSESPSYPSAQTGLPSGAPNEGASDMTVTAVNLDPSAATAAPPVRAGLQLGLVKPNPSSGTVSFRLTLADAAPVQISVFDTRGRLVREMGPQSLGSGSHLFSWSGRTHDGSPAGAGVYYLEIRSGQFRGVQRITLLR